MPFVLLRHKIADYAKWKRVVHAAAAFRKTNGELSFKVLRSSDDPNDVAVICEWASAAKARKFLESDELRKRMKEAGVVGKPKIQFFGKAEDLSVR
ncbi:MAG: antibiotic biosynthesis monooxygenase [Planctomycetes bacterium]|nr:antibiotic biosynthesis monooxygenase [Planctomycetota bacterium]